jgi:hypothetical protein
MHDGSGYWVTKQVTAYGGDIMISFILPGLAAALVFYTIIMSCPLKRFLLKHHWFVDFCFTGVMFLMFAGTYSGTMTAAVGGIIFTFLLWFTWWWWYEPIPVRRKT